MADLDALFSSNDTSDLCAAMSQAGKRRLHQYRERIASFLDHEDPELRQAAIWTLAFHWGMPDYESTAREMGYSDPDELVQGSAISAWARFHDGTREPGILREMLGILLDPCASRPARASAYGAILTISAFPPDRYLKQMKGTSRDVDRNVDWALVRDLVTAAGVESPPALEERLSPSPIT